ncbi:MAG: thiamine-phosphate kinase [Candidatus Aminicenantes bacterium]|nr:thiamine-phosphate kinase [Candidatus Aminicenantes bacterium]
MSETLSDIGEFGLIYRIDNLLKKEGLSAKGTILGIGDDTASVQPKEGYELLITCDSLVDGRHFLSKFMNFYDVGRRAMTANISDIGAMGGRPLYALVSLGLKSDMMVSDIEDMYRGFLSELNPFHAAVIGGNVTQVEASLFIDITLIGEVKAGGALRRSTAKAGDAILVTGYPGEASAGLELLLQYTGGNIPYSHPLIQAYICPTHRAHEGQAIAASGLATAMIDTSDGLLADLAHICSDSGVGADLNRKDLPISDALRETATDNKKDPYVLCTRDSDDYELIVTCATENVEKIKNIITEISDVPLTQIGTISEEREIYHWVLPEGTRQPFTPEGWDHFSDKEDCNE